MKFVAKEIELSKHKAPCLVLAVFDKGKLSASGARVNKTSKGFIEKLLKSGDVPTKIKQSLLILDVKHPTVERLLLLGAGKEPLSAKQFQDIVDACAHSLKSLSVKEVTLCLTELEVKGKDLNWKVRQLVERIQYNFYQFTECKTQGEKFESKLKTIILAVNANEEKVAKQAAREGMAIANAMTHMRNLANLPGNICTPSHLLKEAEDLATRYDSITTTHLDEAAMKKLGMGSFLSVSAGSAQEGKMVIINYQGGKKDDAPYALIGKGITFDTGGISLKPGPDMDQMKYDMSGAASVIGAISAAAELKLPINVIGVLACAENMPGGRATKPGDIVTTMSGQTVEILNTDAEGRLVLCDALTYVEKFNPQAVIDIATLTGACVIALGHFPSGLLSNNEELASAIKSAGEKSQDRVWQLPLWDDYQESLDSNFADIANIGGRSAGTITAACFLSRFTKKYPWAHLDIAGTAWMTGPKKGSTGRPVPLLTQFLIDQANIQSSNDAN